MTKILEIYKCNICGNIVEILHTGGGELVCCGKPMELLREKTSKEEGKEKHVPIIERNDDSTTVKVGTMPHPMEENHYVKILDKTTHVKNLLLFLNF